MPNHITPGQRISYSDKLIYIRTRQEAEFTNNLGNTVMFRGKNSFDALRLAQNAIDSEKECVSLIYFNPLTGKFKGGDGSYASAEITHIAADADLDPFFDAGDGFICIFRDSVMEITVEDLIEQVLSLDRLVEIAFAFETGLFYTETEPGRWKHQRSDQTFSVEEVRTAIKDLINPKEDLAQLLDIANRLDVAFDYYATHDSSADKRVIYQVSIL